jgi:hypothetical protein
MTDKSGISGVGNAQAHRLLWVRTRCRSWATVSLSRSASNHGRVPCSAAMSRRPLRREPGVPSVPAAGACADRPIHRSITESPTHAQTGTSARTTGTRRFSPGIGGVGRLSGSTARRSVLVVVRRIELRITANSYSGNGGKRTGSSARIVRWFRRCRTEWWRRCRVKLCRCR